jgi:hypothetical protein
MLRVRVAIWIIWRIVCRRRRRAMSRIAIWIMRSSDGRRWRVGRRGWQSMSHIHLVEVRFRFDMRQ